jgi:hypothetical protein
LLAPLGAAGAAFLGAGRQRALDGAKRSGGKQDVDLGRPRAGRRDGEAAHDDALVRPRDPGRTDVGFAAFQLQVERRHFLPGVGEDRHQAVGDAGGQPLLGAREFLGGRSQRGAGPAIIAIDQPGHEIGGHAPPRARP